MDDFNYQWPYMNMTQPRETGIDGLNPLSTLSAQFETLVCDYCADNHPSHQCTVSFRPGQYGGDYPNDYAYHNYHQDWGYHPDSSWSYNQQDQYYAPYATYAPEVIHPSPMPQKKNSTSKEFMSKLIRNQEDMMRSQETSSQNFQNQMERLLNTSTNGPQYMDSETATESSRVEKLWFKFIASNEERLIEQGRSIQNLQNQMDKMFEALNNCPPNNWCYDMDSEADGEPEPILQLDKPQNYEKGETSGGKDNEVNKDPIVMYIENEPTLVVPKVLSPPKFKDPVRFAKPCPLGSHVIGQAFSNIKASASLEPWTVEEEKFEEESFVFDMLPYPYTITDTKKEAPTCGIFVMEKCPPTCKLGDFNLLSIVIGNLPKDNLLLMDGGILNYRLGIG